MNGLHRQTATLARSTGRELIWGLRGVSREVDALAASGQRRSPTRSCARTRWERSRASAATSMARRCSGRCPTGATVTCSDVLVAYEVLADYLDCVSERGAGRGIENGRQLHLALVEAVDLAPPAPPTPEISDYYRYHSSREDGGYARALVQRCRAGCERLPSYERMKPLLMRAAGQSGGAGAQPRARLRAT